MASAGGPRSWQSRRHRGERTIVVVGPTAFTLLVMPVPTASSEDSDEGTTERKEDVREMPDHPASRSRLGDLLQPSPQAAAGVRHGANRRS